MALSHIIRHREERKSLDENALWCKEKSKEVHVCTIVNESASGMLIRSDEPLDLGDDLYLLTPCFGEPLTPETLTPRQLMRYPVTRMGKVVRLASRNEFGIQFAEENTSVEFRRWYRDKSVLYSFLTKHVAVIVMEGEINLESSVLLQTLVNTFKRQVSEFVFSLEKITGFVGAAGSVVKSLFKTCESESLVTTIIYGRDHKNTEQLVQNLKGECIFCCNVSNTYNIHTTLSGKQAPVQPIPADIQDSHPESPASNGLRFLVVSTKKTNHKKLLLPIEDSGESVIAVTLMHEAVNKILEYEHHYVVIDIELQELNLLTMLNQIVSKKLSVYPELIIAGPKYVDEIVKAAIHLPVHSYIIKPYTDREYRMTIETILTEYENQR